MFTVQDCISRKNRLLNDLGLLRGLCKGRTSLIIHGNFSITHCDLVRNMWNFVSLLCLEKRLYFSVYLKCFRVIVAQHLLFLCMVHGILSNSYVSSWQIFLELRSKINAKAHKSQKMGTEESTRSESFFSPSTELTCTQISNLNVQKFSDVYHTQ